jgi:glycosyltransferase involved in cell wall biosynthesis
MAKRFKLGTQKTVLHVVTALSWRGGEQQVAYLLEELEEKVNTVVLCSSGSKMEAFCKTRGINHFTCKKRGSVDLNYARTIRNLCKKLAVDLCHLHDAHAHTYAIIAASLFGNPTPLVLSRRVDFPIRKSAFSRFKYNHPAIVKILCVSAAIKEITARGIKHPEKLSVVYSGIDLHKFKKRGGNLRKELKVDTSTFLVGNTSALADHKDYFTFIDTAKKLLLKGGGYFFVIMGDGPMKTEIQQYAAKQLPADKYRFLGFRTDVSELLADLDVFLITSKTEGLGTSILDAFACKLAVVATRAGGIPELVEDKQTGFLCAVKDSEALSNAVAKLAGDQELAQSISNAAYEKVQLFSKEHTAKRTLEEYQSVWE